MINWIRRLLGIYKPAEYVLCYYEPGTTKLSTVYAGEDLTTVAHNPVRADALGQLTTPYQNGPSDIRLKVGIK